MNRRIYLVSRPMLANATQGRAGLPWQRELLEQAFGNVEFQLKVVGLVWGPRAPEDASFPDFECVRYDSLDCLCSVGVETLLCL